MIEQLGFPGYFLIVWDIVEFCRRSDICCQGRGSAANSAVCYAIGITKADASLGLLFERFLSPERDGPPDIDLDIEAAARRSSSTSTSGTAATGPPRCQRDHLQGALGRARHGPRPRVRARSARRLVQAGGRLGAGRGHRRARHPLQVMELARQVQRFPATSASTPAAW